MVVLFSLQSTEKHFVLDLRHMIERFQNLYVKY
jgi:hypothetical protein